VILNLEKWNYCVISKTVRIDEYLGEKDAANRFSEKTAGNERPTHSHTPATKEIQ
jgi:hypothetical protein